MGRLESTIILFIITSISFFLCSFLVILKKHKKEIWDTIKFKGDY